MFKPTDEHARWCIDSSHRSDDNMPLNGGTAKLLSIEHYQKYKKTWTASLVDMLRAFFVRRKVLYNLPWSKFWLFKEDIKSCFPQMDMVPDSAILLAMRITASIIFIHHSPRRLIWLDRCPYGLEYDRLRYVASVCPPVFGHDRPVPYLR